MRTSTTTITLLLGLALFWPSPRVCSAKQAGAKKELAKLQGTWYSLSTEMDGSKSSGEDKADLHIIKGNQVIAKKDGKEISQAEILVEPGTKFGKVTIQMKTGDNKGKTWVGIYEVDGDTLKWCGCWQGDGGLVKEFGTKKGDNNFLRTMKRQKD